MHVPATALTYSRSLALFADCLGHTPTALLAVKAKCPAVRYVVLSHAKALRSLQLHTMAPVAVTLLHAAAFMPLAIPAGVDVLYDLAGLQLNIHVLMSLAGGCRASLRTYARSAPLPLPSSSPLPSTERDGG